MKSSLAVFSALLSCVAFADGVATNDVVDLGNVVVEGTAISRYRPAAVNGGTFTDMPAEKLPVTVDTLTDDFIRENNPTDLHDLLRNVAGIETGGKSLLIRQPGTFSVRGMGGVEPALDGVLPIGRGAGLFMDPFLLERVEIVKGPIGSLNGGSGAMQNASGGTGSINLYMKGAQLERDEINLQENASVGRHTLRQRAMADVNEVVSEDRLAVRVLATGDYYEPTYVNEGRANGGRPRESFTVAPSFVWRVNDSVKMGLKTMFQYTDQPSYIGVPIWRGKPAKGWSWYESSCTKGDRSTYRSAFVNPWLDWQVTDDWLLKFGAGVSWSQWEQHTREPYYPSGAGAAAQLAHYYASGEFPQKYMTSSFSDSECISRNYNFFVRSIYTKELPGDVKNVFVVQPDYYYRESTSGFGQPTSRYGVMAQDSIEWGWFTLMGGVRYDYFHMNAASGSAGMDAHGVSPRGGLTIQPLDWLVFFGNVSQTRTPMLGIMNTEGQSLTKPWFSTQYEGGIRVSPLEKLWLSLSAYRINQENTPVAVDRAGHYESEGKSLSRGIDLSLTGDITDDWTIMAIAGFNKYSDLSVARGQPGRDFERYPQYTFTLNTSYRFSEGILEDVVVGAGYRFKSMSYGTMRGSFVHKNLRFDPSHVFDINVSAPLSKFGGPANWTLTLGIRNLFGEKYIESSRHWYESLAGEPRTFEIGLRANF